jgi:hypothetical protein
MGQCPAPMVRARDALATCGFGFTLRRPSADTQRAEAKSDLHGGSGSVVGLAARAKEAAYWGCPALWQKSRAAPPPPSPSSSALGRLDLHPIPVRCVVRGSGGADVASAPPSSSFLDIKLSPPRANRSNHIYAAERDNGDNTRATARIGGVSRRHAASNAAFPLFLPSGPRQPVG